MNIVLENIGKRFNKEWIFRNISHAFFIGKKYAVLGTNGSGKSTLLQIIAGTVRQTEGEIQYMNQQEKNKAYLNNQTFEQSKLYLESVFQHLSFASPYLELPEEMTWKESVNFHGKFKKYVPELSEHEVISLSGLEFSAEKEIRNFSSGMKQRARLALAILSDTPLLLLDEPSTNLDKNAVKWYQNLIADFTKNKLVIVCSNYNKEEYSFCPTEHALHLSSEQ